MNKKKIAIFVFILIALYAVWNGRNLILGPKIEITSPLSNQSFTETLITIQGTAKNISFLNMNGRQIFVDPEGNFSEDLALLPGLNVIELQGTDRFGKETTEALNLYKHN